MKHIALRKSIGNIKGRVENFSELNSSIAMQTHILAMNSSVEAARAGDSGRGFAVVAQEIKKLADQTRENAQAFSREVLKSVDSAERDAAALEHSLAESEGNRLVQQSLNLVQLLVRNLFERTADVRWWATDEALWKAAGEPTPELCARATERLRTIHRYYTVYHDLVLFDLQGKVLCSALGQNHAQSAARQTGTAGWFTRAGALRSGDEYSVSKVYASPLHAGRRLLTYATAVREGGQVNGRALGILAVYFDWQSEAQTVVQEESGFSEEELRSHRALILDADHRVIASSDTADLDMTLTLPVADASVPARGCTSGPDGALVAYARTVGYQEYDGLGWYGVIVRAPERSVAAADDAAAH